MLSDLYLPYYTIYIHDTSGGCVKWLLKVHIWIDLHMTRWGMCQVDVLCACETTYKSVIKTYGILILPFIYLVSPRKTLELWSQLWNAEYLLLWMSEIPTKKVLLVTRILWTQEFMPLPYTMDKSGVLLYSCFVPPLPCQVFLGGGLKFLQY